MEKTLSPQFILKVFQGGKYALVIIIFVVSLNFFGLLTTHPSFLTFSYIYLMLNGSAAGAIIYRGHQVKTTKRFCPKCQGALDVRQEYICPACGNLKFEK